MSMTLFIPMQLQRHCAYPVHRSGGRNLTNRIGFLDEECGKFAFHVRLGEVFCLPADMATMACTRRYDEKQIQRTVTPFLRWW